MKQNLILAQKTSESGTDFQNPEILLLLKIATL